MSCASASSASSTLYAVCNDLKYTLSAPSGIVVFLLINTSNDAFSTKDVPFGVRKYFKCNS